MNYTLLATLCQIYDSPASSYVFCAWQDLIHAWAYMHTRTHTQVRNTDHRTFYKLSNHDPGACISSEGEKKIQMKAFFKITEQDIFKSILVSFFFFSLSFSILNSAWWPTLLEPTWRRVSDMLNTLSGVNNAGADCKSLYAPGGVNKGDCSVLYFLFTHLCSARWRSDMLSPKPYSRLCVCIGMKLDGLDQRNTEHCEHPLSASLTKSIFNTPLLLLSKKPCGMYMYTVSVCVFANMHKCVLENNTHHINVEARCRFRGWNGPIATWKSQGMKLQPPGQWYEKCTHTHTISLRYTHTWTNTWSQRLRIPHSSSALSRWLLARTKRLELHAARIRAAVPRSQFIHFACLAERVG